MQIDDFTIELAGRHYGRIPRVGSPYRLRHQLLMVNNLAICNSEVWLDYTAGMTDLRVRLKGRVIFTQDRFDEELVVPREELEYT